MAPRMIRMRKALTPKKIVSENNPEDSIKKERKPIRWRSGTVAMRVIKHLQNRYHGLLIPKSAINRLVREVIGNNCDFCLSRNALTLIHSELEVFATEVFNKAGKIAYGHGKYTVTPKQMRLVFETQMERTLQTPSEYIKSVQQ